MRDWDPAASSALQECKQALEERDVVRWLREVTRAMWRPNAERYEPSHLFDTPRGLEETIPDAVAVGGNRSHPDSAYPRRSTSIVRTQPRRAGTNDRTQDR